jgi:hypothetical protein
MIELSAARQELRQPQQFLKFADEEAANHPPATGDFLYQIDLQNPPRDAAALVTDENFLRPARPQLVK